jgi:hypothetical protein
MQAKKFYEQVVADGRVFTFCSGGEFLVYPVRGQDVVPFWSSRSRLKTIAARLPKYREYLHDETPLPEFHGEVLPALEAEGVLVGVNWSGPRLVGYNLPVADLMRNLDRWIANSR